jgi:hypothetical protein
MRKLLVLLIFLLPAATAVWGQQAVFQQPPVSARPWVFWYWMHGAVSKAGIKADLEAMQQVGIAGAYLMPIKDTSSNIPFAPTARQLSPEWWEMVRYAMQEADRLGLELGMHYSDGFALGGGPWIKPEQSMQKVVWTKTRLRGGEKSIQLAQPEAVAGFYKDIAVFAYPATSAYDSLPSPVVTTSTGTFNDQGFRSDTACWIQYQYKKNFTARSLRLQANNNYQAQRLIIQASSDGKSFRTITRLDPAWHGWQDNVEDYTYAIPATTATYFRFVFDKTGTEAGAEDLDAAKWKPVLKLKSLILSDEPVIHQYEAKNGSIWRSAATTTQVEAVPIKKIITLTGKMDQDGRLQWTAPPGNWTIIRMGHTSTGQQNATGGAGKGLECDKFDTAAINLQFDQWFGKAFAATDPLLAQKVLKVFHLDSWECGSQNWSETFAAAFRQRRGYDLMPYLPVMAGVPIESAEVSEKVLFDVRQTIAELVNDVFYKTVAARAKEKGCRISAESVAPVVMSDGMLHYQHADMPMGEFWLNSPTHDKPNDMLDAISGAHIYGKNIVQAEAFTSLRMNWGEHPGMLKATGDRNFALGINRMSIHVFTHNPWTDKKPGMTLDGVGLYYQRDQTWFAQSKAWIDYLSRCQALLQLGRPVTDIAVFAGMQLPRRAVLPERLVSSLPGLFGKTKVDAERIRLANTDQPLRTIPDGVTHSANMADPEDLVNPLRGYAYDSFNPDVLMQMRVNNGRVELPGGASYAVLVFPREHPLQREYWRWSLPVLRKLVALVNEGATVMMDLSHVGAGIGLKDDDKEVQGLLQTLRSKVIALPYEAPTLKIMRDVEQLRTNNTFAWTHRAYGDTDIYFISNQEDSAASFDLAFRVTDKSAEIWDPVTGTINGAGPGSRVNLRLEAAQSVFVIFRKQAKAAPIVIAPQRMRINGGWSLQFDTAYGGPARPVAASSLESWAQSVDPAMRYYSGTVVYSNQFSLPRKGNNIKLKIDSIFNIATVRVNGIDCGTIWTPPYEADITAAVKQGMNRLEIIVTNTWHNRLIGDQLPGADKITYTTAPFRLKDKPLLPAGLTGNIELEIR